METLTRDNYYNYGDADNVVISNSMLSIVNPDEGGSITRLRKYLTEREEEKYALHLEKGKLLHRYLENPREFAIFNGTRPSETGMVEVLEHSFHHVSEICRDTGTEPGSLEQYEGVITDSVNDSIWQPRWKTETKVKKVLEEGTDYWEFLRASDGSHILTDTEYTALTGMIDSLESSPYRDEIKEFPGGKEIPISGKYSVAIGGAQGSIATKGLIDMLYLEGSVMNLSDIKTTGKPASQFMGYRRVGITPEGDIQNKWYDGSFHNFRYYRQLAFYRRLVEQNTSGISNRWYNIYVFETSEPYEIRKYPIMEDRYFTYADQEIAQCMQQVARYIQKYVVQDF